MGKMYIGTSQLKNAWIGTSPVKKIWIGTTLVYPSGFSYSYTGTSSFSGDAMGDWTLTLKTGGTLTVNSIMGNVDVWCVGGGGGGGASRYSGSELAGDYSWNTCIGASGGGGGGYTALAYNVALNT